MRRQRNQRGEFIPVAEDQVATFENQVEADTDEQRQVIVPVENRTNLGTIVSLKRWKIAVTPNRAQVFLWAALLITKFLSMLSIISFWLCIVMAIKTLPGWNGPIDLFQGILRRRAPQAGPANGPANAAAGDLVDNWWEDLFPAADVLNSYHVRVGITQTGHHGAQLIFGYGLPVMLSNPIIWAGAIAATFTSYHFLSFIHGCIRRAHHATNVIARRRST